MSTDRQSPREGAKPGGREPRQSYEAPAIRTESLTAVAALCNGTTTGGRKATSPACNSTKLKS
jgi:hypothetical protein